MPRSRRAARLAKVGVFAALVALSAGIAASCWAFFTTTGTGQASGAVRTLNAPTSVTATMPNPNVRTVHVTWVQPTTPDNSAPTSFTVARSDGTTTSAACGTGTTPLPGSAISCDDTSVPSGTFTYTVTMKWNSWTSTSSPSASVPVAASTLTSFTINPSTTTPTAGTSFTATVTAVDQYGATLTAYSGTKTVAWSGLSTSPAPASRAPSYPTTSVAFTSGVSTTTLTATAYGAGANTLTMTESAKSGSANLTVAIAALDHFIVSPSTTTPTAGTSFTATVAAHDLYDNTVTSYSGTKTVAWSGLSTSPAPASRAPSYPTTSVAFTSGVSTTTLTATAYGAGANTLTMTESAKSGSANLTVAVAALDHFIVSPSTTTPTAGTSFTTTVAAHDLYDNTVTSYSGTKTVAWSGLSTSPAPASRAPTYPTTSVAFTSGTSTTTLTATVYAAGANTLTVTESATSGSANLTVSVAALDHFTVSPSTTTPTAGTSFTATVAAHDLYDNTVTSYSGTKTVAWSGLSTSPAPATRAPSYPTTSVAFTSGASTTTLTATAYAAGANTLTMTESAKSGSANLTVAVAALDHFIVSPSTTTPTAGTSFTTTVAAHDLYDNTVTSYSGTKTVAWSGLSTSPAPATRAPSYPTTSVAFTSGASTTTLTATAYAAGANTLTMTESATSGSANLTVTAGAATQLIQTTATRTAGTTFSETVQAADVYANTVTSYSGNKTLNWSGPGSAPIGTAPVYPTNPVNFSAGSATVNVTLYKAESPAITVSDGTLSGTSATFTVNPASATKMSFTTQPGGGTGGTAWTTQPAVTLQDSYNNIATNDTSSVTLAIGTNPGPGNLSGTTTVPVSSGVATFSGLSIDKVANGYTLTATDGSISSVTSSTFNITLGPAAKLAFTQQPSGGASSTAWTTQPKVTIQDAGGNTVNSTASVTLAVGTNPSSGTPTLTCTANPKAATAGVVTFAGCKIDLAGTGYTLTATSGTLTSATSSAFNITPGAISKLVFTTQPGNGLSPQPVITVEDAAGNTVTSSSENVTMAIGGTHPAGAAIGGTTTVATVNGVATFTDLTLNKTGNYTLKASITSPNLNVTSSQFTM